MLRKILPLMLPLIFLSSETARFGSSAALPGARRVVEKTFVRTQTRKLLS